jgi:ABC-type amino acid transport substrate-binding protein
MRILLAVPALLAGLAAPAPALALAQPPAAPQAPPQRELVVGTRVASPFAMKNGEGGWEGISIDLWRHVAERLGLRYRLEERDTVQALLEAVTTRQVDAAAAALTVTAARRQVMDFTQPFFATGLGVAVGRGDATAWLPVLRTFLSFGFLQGVLTLVGIALLVGALIWLFERQHHEAYGGPPLRGFIAEAWWSAVAMTQAGAAQDGPRTLPGRVLAVVWMVASVVTIAVFIAGITSALTTQRMHGVVCNLGDRPLLAWTIRQDFPELEVLPITLDSQNYAIALPLENSNRVALDVALLETLRSEWWAQTRLRYLGRDAAE